MDNLSNEETDSYLLNQNNEIIHQIWFDTGILPKRESLKLLKSLSKYQNSWITNNPTWCYKLWNTKDCRNFMKSYYPEHLNMYDSYPYQIQRCDCVRYFILHRYGGLYADMDYCCVKPWKIVTEKFKNKLYLVETPNKINNKIHVSNSLMYSHKNNIFWKHLFIELEKNRSMPVYYGKHMTIMYTTGPCIINRVFNKFNNAQTSTYPYKLFHPFGITTDIHETTDTNIYAYHLQQSSWSSLDSKIINFLYREYEILLCLIILLILKYILSLI